MKKIFWATIGLVLLAGMGFFLAGCSTQLTWLGAGGVDCEWDEYDYKSHKEGQLAPAAGDQDALRRQAEAAMRRAEEEQKQLEFGPCTGNDLINRTCH